MKFTIHNISKAAGGRDLFKDFSLEISSGVRLAVVGPNGAGKTTLLRLLSGVEEPDAGRVIIPKQTRLGYAAQEMNLEELNSPLLNWVMDALPSWAEFWNQWEKARHDGDEAALMALGQRQNELESVYGYNPEQRAHEVLSGLGFSDNDLMRPLAALSGGWRERARLARPLVAGADLLLLDEPTNHLDLEAVEWLENFLLEFKGILVFVAHDRFFLDKVGTHVLFLGSSKPLFRTGVFSNFLQAMEEMEEQRSREAKKLTDELGKKMDFIRRFRAKATKARQAANKKKQALRLERQLAGLTPEPIAKTLSFSWPEPKRGDKLVCSAVDLAFSFSSNEPLWPPLNFNIYHGQKIALIGSNGCGKSTLLKLVQGLLTPTAGHIGIGSLTEIGYFSQYQLETMLPYKTALSEIRRLGDPKISEEDLRAALGLFMLGEPFFERQVQDLSGGEKSRLMLASLFLAKANFLILDEPTNHLDLESREALIEALEDYSGTLLFVAHDRLLLERVAEQVWLLSRHGGLKVYLVGMEEYGEVRHKEALSQTQPCSKNKKNDGLPREGQKRLKREQAERRNRISRELKPLQDRYARKETELEILLARMGELEGTLAAPETYTDKELMNKLLHEYQAGKENGESLIEELEELEARMQMVELKWREENGTDNANN